MEFTKNRNGSVLQRLSFHLANRTLTYGQITGVEE
jgi:hypothetical protein